MKKVKCPTCGKEFKNNAGLSAHMRFAHGRKPARVNDKRKPWEKLEPVELPAPSLSDMRELDLYRRTVGALQYLSPKTKQVFDSVYEIVSKGD
jgi:uncharacterized C2H2 Zn-finger protein